MIAPLLGSLALGLVKGLAAPSAEGDDDVAFSWTKDLIGPAKEELVYRALPLWALPNLPYGSTALVFAADHLVDDYRYRQRQDPPQVPTAWEVIARFSDVFLGGLLYESAFKRHGLLAAIASHSAHNVGCTLGTRLR